MSESLIDDVRKASEDRKKKKPPVVFPSPDNAPMFTTYQLLERRVSKRTNSPKRLETVKRDVDSNDKPDPQK